MKTFTLKNKFQTNATLVANDFIDHYMVQANGEFVKVYLFLLRHLDNAGSSLTVSAVADCLNNTENDILRAFKYWESKGLLQMECDAEGHVCELELIQIPQTQAQIPITAAKKPSAPVVSVKPAAPKAVAASVSRPAAHADAAKAQKQLKSLLFIAEQYLGKTLTKTDMDAITYFYDHLGMSADLIELSDRILRRKRPQKYSLYSEGRFYPGQTAGSLPKSRQNSNPAVITKTATLF